MLVMSSDFSRGLRLLTNVYGCVSFRDKVLIIVDDSTKEIGEALAIQVQQITNSVILIKSCAVVGHGVEPEDEVASLMAESTVIFGMTTYSMAHTKARAIASKNGARYLSLPDYNISQVESPALEVEVEKIAEIAEHLKLILNAGKVVRVATANGTNVTMGIDGRVANACPGFCDKPGMLGSPPDMETNIAPLEYMSEGIIVVDGSIPYRGLGLIEKAIKIFIEKGMIFAVDSSTRQGQIVDNVFVRNENPRVRVLAEFGIGLNPSASLCGRMLEDEGCAGTVHFGFGSNGTIGGNNFVNFHVDFVVRQASIWVDDVLIMKNGGLIGL